MAKSETAYLPRLVVFVSAAIIGGFILNWIGPLLIFAWARKYALDPFATRDAVFPKLGYTIMAIGVSIAAYYLVTKLIHRVTSISVAGIDIELQQAIQRAQAEPEKAKPAWDLARVRLELYFDRNLSQINYIFWLSVGVMIVGFVFVLLGISLAFLPTVSQSSTSTSAPAFAATPAVVGAITGVITEFIGATFLFIFRSTIEQAAAYTQTLERINSVGMAMQILDTISTDSKELQDTTKAAIVKMLLSRANVPFGQNRGDKGHVQQLAQDIVGQQAGTK